MEPTPFPLKVSCLPNWPDEETDEPQEIVGWKRPRCPRFSEGLRTFFGGPPG